MKSLIIGAGEVGKALFDIISREHNVTIRDIDPIKDEDFKVIHICYPDSPKFVAITKSYIQEYNPEIAIIHSSVAIGTTEKCGNSVVYSPVRGRHPDNGLTSEIPRFVKYVASADYYAAKRAKNYLDPIFTVEIMESPKSLEFFKLISNIHMGFEIAWRQEVQRIMDANNIWAGDYEDWETTYRNGYMELGQFHLMRPLMRPDPIGGHCIIPCTEILSKQFPSKFFDLILESNEKAKKEYKV